MAPPPTMSGPPGAGPSRPRRLTPPPPAEAEPEPGKVGHLDEQLVRDRLGRARIARIGYVDLRGPLIVPVNVVVDTEQRVIFHTARESALARLDGHSVAVEIDGFDQAHHAGWSILVRGVAHDVTDAEDPAAEEMRHAAVDCWAPGSQDRVFAVVPLSIDGRHIPVGPDGDWFLGAPSS